MPHVQKMDVCSGDAGAPRRNDATALRVCERTSVHKHRGIRESDIEKYLVAKAKEHGGEVRKVKWIGRRGAPDRLLMRPYRVGGAWTTIWVELKAPGKKPDAHQAREHARMWRMDQIVVVIDSIEGVDALFA